VPILLYWRFRNQTASSPEIHKVFRDISHLWFIIDSGEEITVEEHNEMITVVIEGKAMENRRIFRFCCIYGRKIGAYPYEDVATAPQGITERYASSRLKGDYLK